MGEREGGKLTEYSTSHSGGPYSSHNISILSCKRSISRSAISLYSSSVKLVLPLSTPQLPEGGTYELDAFVEEGPEVYALSGTCSVLVLAESGRGRETL